MEGQDKKIDQEWKDTVEKEKDALKREGKFIPKEPDFNLFVTTLALQASISLGAVPNPATNKQEEDLSQARFLIDTLSLLRDKTKGNLAQDESDLLDNLLYELRMQYIKKSEAGEGIVT